MEEQLGDSNKEQALGKRDASNSQGTSTKKKGRGPSKEVQSSTPIFLEFDDFDLPTGKWEASYGKHIGKCALKIDINVKAYPKLDEVDKKNLWEETKQKFHIDDPKGVKEKNFHMAVGARFRRFKSWLIARFITKTKAPSDDSPNAQLKPWELYEGYITEDQWKEFEAYVKSEEFKAKSEKGMEGAKNNKYRHHLGQKSYERAWEGWSKSNRIPTPTVPESSITCSAETSSTALNQKVTNRPLAWVLARQIKLPNGSWGIDPNDAPTAEIANSVLENLQKKDLMREEGKDTHEEWGIDALTMALGRMDKRGYVKGLGRGGVGLCHTKAFGKSNRKRKSSSEISFEKLEEMKASLRKEFEARLEEKLQEEMEGRLGQRVAMELNAYLSSIIPQFTSTNFPQVNRPETSASVIGVSSEVSRVLECMSPPPKKLKAKESKEKVGTFGAESRQSDSGKGMQLLEDNIVNNLTQGCELLYWRMNSDNEKYDTIVVPLKAPLFYQDEDKEIYVTSTDVSEFLKGAWANVSLVHVYILYLYYKQISILQISEITFLCPQRISEAEIKQDYLEVYGYIKKAFLSELAKERKHCKFILAPYLESNHWVLLVIDLQLGHVFVFDPATQPKQKLRKLRVAGILMKAYKVYLSKLKGNALKTRRKDLLFKQIECAQQTKGTECGYYVMRFMYEVVVAHNGCKGDLEKDYFPRTLAYKDGEICKIREQWANFFRRKFLLQENL